MNKSIIAAAILALSFSASAESVRPPPTGNPPKPIVTEAPKPADVNSMQQSQQQSTSVRLQSSNTLNSTTAVGVNFEAHERDPVSSAYAAALTTSNGTCMGSSSGGAQGASFGFSVGGTWVDAGCDARYDAQALLALGLKAAAVARLCAKPELRDAIERTGQSCFDKPKTAAKADEPQDPYVRRRLGLAPL
jgi:hypothetical protein